MSFPRLAGARAAGLGIVLLAFALRLAGVTGQSLWYDEGTSAALARRSWPAILAAAAGDIHPPLYYLALAGWTRLAGDGVLAMRLLSALAGTLLVAGLITLGRRLWGRPQGLAAGLLAACSPFLVWYSQELRMYMPAAALGVLLVWLSLDRIEDPVRAAAGGPNALRARARATRGWLAWALAALAGLYTQYFVGGSMWAAANLIVLAALAGGLARAPARGRADPAVLRSLAGLFAANLAIVLLYLPWLARAWPAMRDWPPLGGAVSAAFVAREGLAAFALGTRLPPALGAWALPIALLALAGLGARGRDGRRAGAWVAGIWLATPLALMALLSFLRPAWNAKLLIGAAPALELLAGAGAIGLAGRVAAGLGAPGGAGGKRRQRRLALVLASGLLVLALWPRLSILQAVRSDPKLQRDDYRGMAARIDREAGPSDAVLLNAPTQIEIFDYYDRGRHAAYPIPLSRPPDAAATRARLEAIAAGHRDLFALLWALPESDPEGLVEAWLNAHRHKVADEWYGNVRLALWAAERGPVERAWQDPAVFGAGDGSIPPGYVDFGSALRLAGLSQGPLTAPAGEILTLALDWIAREGPAADYVVFTQLLDANGALVAQRDMAPGGGSARTSAWEVWRPPGTVGEAPAASVSAPESAMPAILFTDRIGLQLPVDLAPGSYRLVLGLYEPATGTRLAPRAAGAAAGGDGGGAEGGTADAYAVGTVTVLPAGPPPPSPQTAPAPGRSSPPRGAGGG